MLWYTQSEYSGGIPVFLLEITWCNRVYRFANFAVILSSADGDVEFTDGLKDFDFKETADLYSVDIEANIVSCAVEFQPHDNILKEFGNGNVLEGSEAVFSYVIYKNDTVQNSYEDKIVLMRGQVQEPQYGDPDESDEFVAMSIEPKGINTTKTLIQNTINLEDFPLVYWDIDSATAKGKAIPIVIGVPGATTDPDGTTEQLYSAPAYCIKRYASGTADFIISLGSIDATQVVIQDENYRTKTVSVVEGSTSRGELFSYIAVPDTISMPGYLTVDQDSRSWYVTFSRSTGGGILNPYNTGSLSGGGDVLRWAIQKTGGRIDDGAFANLSPLLNKYEFAGVINDPSITAFEWITNNLLPYLPVSLRAGPNGIQPILNTLNAITNIQPLQSIRVGDVEEFRQLSAVEITRATTDLINVFTMEFAKVGYSGTYANNVRCTNIATNNNDIPSDYAVISQSRYGLQEKIASSDYIYSRDTAEKIALEQVRANALPTKTLDISAPIHYGFFQIGDILEVTVDRLFLIDIKMMVIEKEYVGAYWRFKLAFEDNPVIQ